MKMILNFGSSPLLAPSKSKISKEKCCLWFEKDWRSVEFVNVDLIM